MKPSSQKSREPLRVCVIGAGVCGLVSVKASLEAGLSVTCYEKSSQYGGLWCYRGPPPASEASLVDNDAFEASVMRTTILNTSKELSAFSDYPPPATLPNFMRHNLYMDYIRGYVDHFGLMAHIKFRHQVVSCRPEWSAQASQDHAAGEPTVGQQTRLLGPKICWLVRVRDLATGLECEQHFDRLMVAIGHHNVPYMPTFAGQDQFQGRIVHSASVKDILTDPRFVDKRVLVVGLGNSACDAANDLAVVSSKCYVSCHRGNWFLSRLNADGLYDFKLKSRWYSYMSKLLPARWADSFIIKKLQRQTNHSLLGLRPKHSPREHVPAINDLFPYRILTGGVCLKGSVARFTQRGAIFEGEQADTEHELDAVIMATGYVAQIPFLNEQQLGLRAPEPNDDEFELYLNMFAPRLNIPPPSQLQRPPAESEQLARSAIQSLAFIGLVQPSGSITVISELQARYAVQLFQGHLSLPSIEQMLLRVKQVRSARSGAIRSHSRDQLVGDWIGYLDLIANEMGVKPNLSHLFFKDFQLWRQLMFGPSVPYQYRLRGCNRWLKARDVILRTNERVYQGINEGNNDTLFKSRRRCLTDARTSEPDQSVGWAKRNKNKNKHPESIPQTAR